jgi:CheY-like chemotaxis protein
MGFHGTIIFCGTDNLQMVRLLHFSLQANMMKNFGQLARPFAAFLPISGQRENTGALMELGNGIQAKTGQQTILVVDDNQAEIEMLKEAISEVCPGLILQTVMSGEDCLAVLRRTGRGSDTARPDLILLDLNMPGISGRAVLAEIKSDPDLCHVPVIILTTSGTDKDVIDTYRRHANSYIIKPLSYSELKEMVGQLLHYWLQVARIPATC